MGRISMTSRRSYTPPSSTPAGLVVLTLAGDQICGITRLDNSTLPHFGLPRTL
jgi:hypothetical protein